MHRRPARARLESLLESYYGMQDEDSAAADAADIDSGSFDVAGAASAAVASKGLPELLAYKASLASAGARLDGEMQNLVYNNYNRFIAATDTIRAMRARVGEMEGRMGGLVVDMRAMGGESATLNDKLQGNRGKIEQLIGVKSLLVKLEFLFELPVRLRRAIELDAASQAVRFSRMRAPRAGGRRRARRSAGPAPTPPCTLARRRCATTPW